MRNGVAAGVVAAVVLTFAAAASAAEVVISVNKAEQSMSVLVDGAEAHRWIVSTGTGGGPPDGSYRVERLHRHWFSRTFNNAPMPYSIFFYGPYAIHGTDKISMLGRRASKGCVRLHPRDAAVLFELVQREKAGTTIVISKTAHVPMRVPPADTTADQAAAPQNVGGAKSALVEAKPADAVVARAERLPKRVRSARDHAARHIVSGNLVP